MPQIPASEVARCQNAEPEPNNVLLNLDNLHSFSVTFNHIVAQTDPNLFHSPQQCLLDPENR